MNVILALNVWGKVIIVSVVTIFLVVSIINFKTKKPENYNDEECEACDFKNTCPIVIRETKDEENSK